MWHTLVKLRFWAKNLLHRFLGKILAKKMSAWLFGKNWGKKNCVSVFCLHFSWKKVLCLCFGQILTKIKLAVKYSSLNLFADDSTLSYACNNIEDGIKAMNKDLSKIYDWTCANKLSLNVTKTKAMIIASRSKKYAEICEKYKCDFKINDQPIELVDEIKLLGIMIDQHHLTFKPHVEYLSRKMLKKFYVLKRCDSRLNCYSIILFYKSKGSALAHFV